MMKELKINHLAVLVAIVLQFVLRFLWYGPLLSENPGWEWLALIWQPLKPIRQALKNGSPILSQR